MAYTVRELDRPMRLELACKMDDGDWLGRLKSGKWAHVYILGCIFPSLQRIALLSRLFFCLERRHVHLFRSMV